MPARLLLILLLTTAVSSAFARPQPLKSGMSAQADSAATAADNPAGITRFDSTQVRGDLYYINSESTWESSFTGTGGTSPVTVDDTDSDIFAPNIAIVKPLSDKWYFGFSMLAYTVSDEYGDGEGRFVIEDYDLLFISAYPSIAYKMTEKWSVAASLAGTYTSYEQNSRLANLPEPGNPNPSDAKLEIDADGYTLGFGFSTLYEFTDRTRIGFNYQSELDPTLDGDLDFSNLTSTTAAALDFVGLLGSSIDVETASPQRASVGIYHEFENAHAATFDVAWIDFSDFKLAEIYVSGSNDTDYQLNESDFDYDDIWAYIAGYSFPLSDRFTLALAGLYVPEMVDDDNRQITLRIDEIWGAGIGLEWRYSDNLLFDATFNYIQIDDSPVESDPTFDPDLGFGTVSGEFTDRDFFLFQFGVEWGAGPR
ncbi:MAG: OmpP1/FadL family transporter [Gammaproteobacteria bacterium]